MKKVLKVCITLLVTTFSFSATEYSIKSGLNFDVHFKPYQDKYGNKLSNISYDSTGYGLNLVEFNANLKDIGLKLGASLLSSRENILKSDYKPNKTNSHDVYGNIFAEYDKKFGNTDIKLSSKYYLPNIFNNQKMSDLDKNESGKLNLLADVKTRIKDTRLGLKTEYVSKNFSKYDVDGAKFDIKLDLLSSVKKEYTISSSYEYKYDLKNSTKPFNPFDTELKSFPDFMGGNYVDFMNHKFNLELSYEPYREFSVLDDDDKFPAYDKYLLALLLDVETMNVGGTNYLEPKNTFYNKYIPNLKLSYSQHTPFNFKLKYELENEFKINHTVYNPTSPLKQVDLEVVYNPKFNFYILADEKLGRNSKIKNTLKATYNPNFTLEPSFRPLDEIRHIFELSNNFELEYKLDKNTSYKIAFDGLVRTTLFNSGELNDKKPRITDLNGHLNVELSVNHKFNDKHSIEAGLKNKFSGKNFIKVLSPDYLQDSLNIYAKYEGKLLDNLKLNTNFELKHVSNMNYMFDSYPGKVPEYLGYSGKFYFTHLKNSLELNNTLTYSNKFSDNLSLDTIFELNTLLELFALRSGQEATQYLNDMKNNEMMPIISDYNNTKYNVGGKIEMYPHVVLNYEPIKNFKIKLDGGLNILFNRKVVNRIQDKHRVDNNKFGFIDKDFNFRDLSPKIKLNAEYNW